MVKLKYTAYTPIFIPLLKSGKKNVYIKKDDEIEVSEKEARSFLRMLDGVNPCFTEVKEARTRRKKEDENQEENSL